MDRDEIACYVANIGRAVIFHQQGILDFGTLVRVVVGNTITMCISTQAGTIVEVMPNDIYSATPLFKKATR